MNNPQNNLNSVLSKSLNSLNMRLNQVKKTPPSYTLSQIKNIKLYLLTEIRKIDSTFKTETEDVSGTSHKDKSS